MISSDNKMPLYGLVLAGGKSTRMGSDKALLQWHGKEQRYYMVDMLNSVCDDVYISCRVEQQKDIDNNYKTIADAYDGLGPYGAILSALTTNPNAAWLVVACDLPLLDNDTINQLISERDIKKMATTFESPYDGHPEPLITIWEPKSMPVLESYIPEGFRCPRKALMRNMDNVKIIKANNPDALINTNTPEDAEKVNQILADAR